MPALRLEIVCITPDSLDKDQRIDGIGGYNAPENGGGRWYLPIDDAIAGIESGKWSFWTKGGGRPVNVIIARRNSRKYLKTEADGEEPNNLLSLPKCP